MTYLFWISLSEIGFYVGQYFLNIFKHHVPRFMYPGGNAELPIGMASIIGFETCCRISKKKTLMCCLIWIVRIYSLTECKRDSMLVLMVKFVSIKDIQHMFREIVLNSVHYQSETSNSCPVELPNLNHNVQPCRGLMLGEKSGVQRGISFHSNCVERSFKYHMDE